MNELFIDLGQNYPVAEVNRAAAFGAETLLSVQPTTYSLADISSGREDAALNKLARQIKASGVPMMLSFAHEFNGDWYTWGTKTTTAAQFVAAWRRMHDVFATVGAKNVTWIWTPNVVNARPTIRLAPYYPGDQYVDVVGIVGYWAGDVGGTPYQTLYGPTEREVSAFTGKKFMLTETAVAPGPHRAELIAELFAGVEADPRMLGLVWFERDKRGVSRYETNWTLETDAPALAAFRLAVRSYPEVVVGG